MESFNTYVSAHKARSQSAPSSQDENVPVPNVVAGFRKQTGGNKNNNGGQETHKVPNTVVHRSKSQYRTTEALSLYKKRNRKAQSLNGSDILAKSLGKSLVKSILRTIQPNPRGFGPSVTRESSISDSTSHDYGESEIVD